MILVPQKVEAGEISKKKAVMEVDSELKLKVSGTSNNIKWSTDDKNVVTVTKKGKIKAKNEGEAVVTAKTNGNTYKCYISVVDSNKGNTVKNDVQIIKEETTSSGIKKGDVLYDGESITISYYGWKDVDDYDDDSTTKAVCLELLVTNKMNDIIEIQSDCISINGYSFNGIVMSDSVSPGKKGIVYPTIYDFKEEFVDLSDIYNIGGTLTIVEGGFMGSVSSHKLEMHTVTFDYEKK